MKRLLEAGGDGYYEEKKSKFIAKTYPVGSETEVTDILASVRKQYYDARHNCYAYVIDDMAKSSDDGEPSGTAGKPILEVINGAGLKNCLIVVTRYFGGTLLGTGGLVRAYEKAAKDALEHSKLVTVVPGVQYRITVDYTAVGKVQRMIAAHNAVAVDTEYGSSVAFLVDIPEDGLDSFLKEITNETAGKAVLDKMKETDIKLLSVYDR